MQEPQHCKIGAINNPLQTKLKGDSKTTTETQAGLTTNLPATCLVAVNWFGNWHDSFLWEQAGHYSGSCLVCSCHLAGCV